MRRIVIGFSALALLAGLTACSSDAPTQPPVNPPGGTGSSALRIQLFASDANPNAGNCTLIQAIVTLNGANVADGTGVAFSTDLGVFGQNGRPSISNVTTGGATTTALCSTSSGVANVRARATVAGKAGSASIAIAFQASQSQAFITFCNPTFGPNTGGTNLTINGGRFFGDPTTTRVTFTAAGATREALVTAVTSTSVSVVTPVFLEAVSPSVPVQIRITLGANTPSPVTLTAPNCFAYGTADIGTPKVTAVLPSSGKNEGGTRVTIFGSGFQAPLQVFFGPVEAQVLSVAYNQIVALTPAAFGAGAPNLNQTVDVRVHEVASGLDGILPGGFRYTPAIKIISFEGFNVQNVSGPFSPVTIHGQGFSAPVKVSLAGFVASVISVSATEVVVLPGNALVSGCTDISGPMTVTNIDTGDSASGQSFTYSVKGSGPVITGVSPASAQVPSGGLNVTITGANLQNAAVTFGSQQVSVVSASPGSITVRVQPNNATAPTCPTGTSAGTLLPAGTVDVTVTNLLTTCSATFKQGFTYLLPCTP